MKRKIPKKKPAQVTCDRCTRKISLSYRTTNLPGGIQRVWLKCPHCKTEYTAYYTDDAIRSEQAKQRQLKQDISGIYASSSLLPLEKAEFVEDKMKLIDENKAKIKQMMDELRARMESAHT